MEIEKYPLLESVPNSISRDGSLQSVPLSPIFGRMNSVFTRFVPQNSSFTMQQAVDMMNLDTLEENHFLFVVYGTFFNLGRF